MKLLDLEPQFLRYTVEPNSPTIVVDPATGMLSTVLRDRVVHVYVDSIAEADGVFFLCPKCFEENGGSVGTHGVICWSPKVPTSAVPGPGRWNLVGTGLDDLSLVAGSSSVQLTGGCAWHGYVENGGVRNA